MEFSFISNFYDSSKTQNINAPRENFYCGTHTTLILTRALNTHSNSSLSVIHHRQFWHVPANKRQAIKFQEQMRTSCIGA
jgi:hypothetical protein